MYYPNEIIEQIMDSADIVDVVSEYVNLTQKGNNFTGLCPFHSEKTPSFVVSRDKRMFHCFGCGAGGNVFTFLMQIENFEFPEAIKFLAKKYGIELPEAKLSDKQKKYYRMKERIYDMNKDAGKFFYDNLYTKNGDRATEYLSNRELNLDIRKRFGIGYANESWNDLLDHLKAKGYSDEEIEKSGLFSSKNGKTFNRFRDRLMFPIFDVHNRVIGFGGRILDKGEPKYLNSPEGIVFNKREQLYNMNLAKKAKTNFLIIVEGYMDVISVYQAGFTNVVASLGTAFTKEQASLMKKYVDEVIIAYDGDNAGKSAILRAIPILLSKDLKVKILDLKDQKDPDDFIKSYGRAEFKKAIDASISHIDFKMKMLKSKYDYKNNIDDKIEFVNEITKIINEVTNEIEKDVYVNKISEETGIDRSAILKEAVKLDEKAAPKKEYKPKEENVEDQSLIDANNQLISFMLEDKKIYDKIHEHVKINEFIYERYQKIVALINDSYKLENIIKLSEFINNFSEVSEQNLVVRISEIKEKYDDEIAKEKAITQLIRKIKRSYVDKMIENAEDELKMSLILQKKQIDKINVIL
ncbi:MAG: DNA primase [Clostridia bacterium]|jgi:DNA primase|nr:DNA primase [Clostridia bacterium]